MGIKELLQKFLAAPSPIPSEEIHQLEPVLIEGESFFLAKGTSYRQPSIKKLSLGEQTFLLTPEKGNKQDPKAVMVQGIHKSNSIHVGYLPMGSAAQENTHLLGTMMMAKGKIPMVQGAVVKGDSGLIIRLFLPSNMTLRGLTAKYE